MPQVHRVTRRPVAPPPLPRDTWQGAVFVTAEGVAFDVVWNGASGLSLSPDWPEGGESFDALLERGRIHASR